MFKKLTLKIRHNAIALSILLVGFVLLIFLSYGKPAPQKKPLPPPLAVTAQVVEVTPQKRSLNVYTQGTVNPRRAIDLTVQVGGEVVRVAEQFVAGGYFAQGEFILQVDPVNYEIALVHAEAQLTAAEERLAVVKGAVRQAQREWRDLGDEEANALFLQKPQLKNAQTQIKAAKANVRQAQINLRRTTIHAPYPLRVQRIHVDLGQYLPPNTRIAHVHSTDIAEVRLPLTDRQVAMLQVHDNVHNQRLRANISAVIANKKWQWPAAITRTEASLDVRNRVIYMVAEVKQTAHNDFPPLTSGRFVHAEIIGQEQDNILILPRDALRTGNIIWRVDQNEQLAVDHVDFLQLTPKGVAVRGTYDHPIQVITSPLSLAMPGMKVIVTQQTARDISLTDK